MLFLINNLCLLPTTHLSLPSLGNKAIVIFIEQLYITQTLYYMLRQDSVLMYAHIDLSCPTNADGWL